MITWRGKELRNPVYLPNGLESKYLTEFRELGFLAMGGFGIVAKCLNHLDGKEYAVKKISLAYADTSFDVIQREVDALSSLKHPNIVQYYQAWVESQMAGCTSGLTDSEVLTKEDIESPCLYILMELCSGSLADLVSDMSLEINVQTSLELYDQILKGVGHIHEKGFIHGDLSLSNVFLDKDGNVKVGDLGLARKVEDGGWITWSGDFGNKMYNAPEKARGEQVDSKIDMYSLGIILVELVHPFGTGFQRIRALDDLKRVGIPTEWEDEYAPLIRKLISDDPQERPDVAQVLAELKDL